MRKDHVVGGHGSTLDNALSKLKEAIDAKTKYLQGLGYRVVEQTAPAIAANGAGVYVVVGLTVQPKDPDPKG